MTGILFEIFAAYNPRVWDFCRNLNNLDVLQLISIDFVDRFCRWELPSSSIFMTYIQSKRLIRLIWIYWDIILRLLYTTFLQQDTPIFPWSFRDTEISLFSYNNWLCRFNHSWLHFNNCQLLLTLLSYLKVNLSIPRIIINFSILMSCEITRVPGILISAKIDCITKEIKCLDLPTCNANQPWMVS